MASTTAAIRITTPTVTRTLRSSHKYYILLLFSVILYFLEIYFSQKTPLNYTFSFLGVFY